MKFVQAVKDLLIMSVALIVTSALRQSCGKDLSKSRAVVRMLTRLHGGKSDEDLKPFYALGVNVARQVQSNVLRFMES